MAAYRRSGVLLRENVLQLRTLLVYSLVMLYIYPYCVQGYTIRKLANISLNGWGAFACTMANPMILLICFIGYLLLMSEMPCWSSEYAYEAVRTGKRTMMLSRALLILELTLMYVASLFVINCLLSGCTDYRMDVWDKASYSLARGQEMEGVYLYAPVEIIAAYTPIGAFLMSAGMLFLVFASLGLGVFLCTMLLPFRKIVFAFFFVWGGLDIAVDEMGFGYRQYALSPLSWTRLTILETAMYNVYYPSKEWCIGAAVAMFVMMLMACFLYPVKLATDRLGDP